MEAASLRPGGYPVSQSDNISIAVDLFSPRLLRGYREAMNNGYAIWNTLHRYG